MTDFDLEPPHLTIAVYSDRDERQTFTQLCSVLPKLECSPTHRVEVAPAALEFEMVSDLSGNRETITVSHERYSQIIASLEPGLRAVRAGYSHPKYGNVVAEYEIKEGPDPHPIGASLSAGDLGFPDFLWSAEQRSAAYSMAEWTLSILKAAASACQPLYGAIGVEYSLPTPTKLADSSAVFPNNWFVSRALLIQYPSLEEQLRTIYSDGEVTDWEEGVFCSGWAPYNSGRRTLSQPEEAARNFAAATERAVTEFRHHSRNS